MKKVKLSVLLAAVVIMAGLSSCLKTDENTNVIGTAVLHPNAGGWFEDEDGGKYIPEGVTVKDDSDLAVLTMQYDYTKINTQSNSVNITILGDVDYLDTMSVKRTTTDVEGMVTCRLYNEQESGGMGGVWGTNDYLILPVQYYVTKEEYATRNEEDIEKNLIKKNHKFTVYYDINDILMSKTALNLRLCYDVDNIILPEHASFRDVYTVRCQEPLYISLEDLFDKIDESGMSIDYTSMTTVNVTYDSTVGDIPTQLPNYSSDVSKKVITYSLRSFK